MIALGRAALWRRAARRTLIPFALEHVNEAGYAHDHAAGRARRWGLRRRRSLLLAQRRPRGFGARSRLCRARSRLARRLILGCGLERRARRAAGAVEEPDQLFVQALRDATVAAALIAPTAHRASGGRPSASDAARRWPRLGGERAPTAPIDLAPPAEADAPWIAGGAPYGAVLVDQCGGLHALPLLRLASAPSGALGDNPDKPEAPLPRGRLPAMRDLRERPARRTRSTIRAALRAQLRRLALDYAHAA